MPAFANVDRLVGSKDFQGWLESAAPELNVPTIWEMERQLSPVGQSMYHILAIQAFRPDRLYAAAGLFVNSVSGVDVLYLHKIINFCINVGRAEMFSNTAS